MRHSITDNARPDRVPSVDLADCDTQRMLSDEGRALAKRVGEKVALAQIPMDIPVVSPMCRAKETAMLTYQRAIVEDKGLMYSGSMTSSEKVPVLARTRQLLSDPVALGINRLLVAHAPNLMDVIGYFPKEATLVVFRPEGNGQFAYIGSIPPAHWDSLLAK